MAGHTGAHPSKLTYLRRLTEAGNELREVAVLRHDDRALLTCRAKDCFILGIAVTEIADRDGFDVERV
jgi:hypothetical protein